MFTSEYSNSIGFRPLVMEKATTKWKYNNNIHELAPNCPRCASSNTKFCYYNNYSLSQPRYFCKACRRYWTKGGSLRNVPVGGGCRKSRRSRAARQAAGVGPGHAPACNAGSTDETSGGNGAVIDMAAVFAKYVNQDGENEEYSSSLGASSGSSENIQESPLEIDSQMEEDVTMFEYDDQMQQVISHFSTCDDISGRELVFQDPKSFELEQGVLCDELVADILGLESTTLPSIGGSHSQHPLHVEDFGLFSSDDQFRISAENWASFDLSAYDFYSTF